MDLLELPSISDDELDYELDMPVGEQQKNQQKEGISKKKEVLFVDASRSRKRRNEENIEEVSDEDYTSCHEGDGDDRQSPIEGKLEEEVQYEGRLAGRVKRMAKLTATEEEMEENVAAERFAQILEGKRGIRRKLSDAELEMLYDSLDADPDDTKLRFNALFVTGSVEKMNTFDISRIFAEFDPQTVRPLEIAARAQQVPTAFVVTFENAFDVAQLLLDNTKPLRRIRTPRKPEEGELVESDEEEEGQVKEEGGDDVAVVKDVRRKISRSNSDAVEVDIESMKVPPGKWRVMVNHVPDNRLVLVRFATGLQLRAAVIAAKDTNSRSSHSEEQAEGGSFYKNTKIRPGLNVFDEKGNELDWDYEHDTRFFEPVELEEDEKEKGNEEDEQKGSTSAERTPDKVLREGKYRTKGRGPKKFLRAWSDDEE